MGLIGLISLANTYSTVAAPNGENDYADVYITLIDSATGQPANGNNVVVYYQVNSNGSIIDQQIIISGQSALIYSGLISQSGPDGDGGQEVLYYKSFSVTGVSGTANLSPPVNVCDLKINYINIDKAGSAPGANDAQITVNASSSFLPLLFSLDNVNFQSSPTFTGLSGGLKTVYVTDTNSLGCKVNGQTTIPVLTNLLVSDPSVTIGTNVSRWSAAFNPIVFTYQRKDFEITSITADSLTGNAVLMVNANLSGVMNGDLVYVNAGSYNSVFTVVSTSANSLMLNTPYVTSAAGFVNINRLRPYYQLLTNITYQDQLLQRSNTITSTNRPDGTGLIKADISNFLQSLLRAKDKSDFTAINFRDDNLSASYQVKYAQHWDDGSINGYTSDWITITSPYYVVYAAKQLGDRFGGNMAAFVPFKHVAAGIQPAKWITDFSEPAYSIGYPFDLSFIYGEDLAGLNLYATITLLDINKNPTGTISPVNLINEDGSFLLNQDSSKLLIKSAGLVNMSLIEHVGLNRFLVDYSFDNDVCYFLVGIFYKDTGAPSTFNYSLIQSADPYTDVNLQIKDNSVITKDLFIPGSGTFNMPAGNSFSVEAYTQDTATGTNPKLTLTVLKNNTIIFDETTAAIPGASLVYAGVVAVSHPVESIKALGEIIEQNITNRFKAFGVILDGIIHLDFKKMANGALQAFTGVTNATDKIGKAFTAVKKGVQDTAKDMVSVYKESYKQVGKQVDDHQEKVTKSNKILQQSYEDLVVAKKAAHKKQKDQTKPDAASSRGTLPDPVSKGMLPNDSNKSLETQDPKFPDEVATTQTTEKKVVEIKKTALQQVEEYAKQSGVKMANDALNTLSNSIKQQSDAKVAALEKDKAAELSKSNLTSAQKLGIEQKYRQQENQIKVKAFKEEQELSIAQAIINGAQGVTKVTAQSGLLAALSIGAVVAETAAQVAKIAAQKPPAYAKGGLHYSSDGRGGVLAGYSKTDNTNAYLRSGEGIVVSEAMRVPWARNLVSAINVGFGGRDFSMANSGPGYAVGGIFTDGGDANRYYNQPVHDQKNLANTLAYQMINNFPPVYVDVKDINNQQNILTQTINRVNL